MAAMGEERDPNLLRVMISTDNHLGVWEKDEVRKDDSFESFEEVLKLAKQLDVDFVLLGGDLFHDNKPSRSTLIKTIRILKQYCLDSKPIQFQILSDQSSNFCEGIVNYEDPNLNVGIPVFTIHGNHDDASGTDNSSAVDILSSCGLVNYFGKVPLGGSGIGRVTLSPILVQKGDSRVAVYGLGNIREERLGRLFQTPGAVQWIRPAPTVEGEQEDWLNLFTVHQNRVQHGTFAKSCLQERYLPPFLDLVVWGHEHECRADPEVAVLGPGKGDVEDKSAVIIQPGSSVATALSEGEAKKKHVVLLEMLGSQWRTVKYPLQTVRPFAYSSVALRGAPGVDPEDSATIVAFLENKVEEMLAELARENPVPAGQKGRLPLVRLRVDYTGLSTVHSQRFGQKYVGRVANPQDMLHWTKSAAKGAGKDSKPAAAGQLVNPEALDQARIEDLIATHMNDDLDLIPQEEFDLALHDFVDKDEKDALHRVVDATLANAHKVSLQRTGQELQAEDDISLFLQTRKSQAPAATTSGRSQLPPVPVASSAAAGAGVGGLEDDMDIDAAVAAVPAAAAKPPPAGGRKRQLRQAGIGEMLSQAAGRRGTQAQAPRGASDTALDITDEPDSLMDSPLQPAARGRGRGRGRAAAPAARGRGRAAPTAAPRRGRKAAVVSDDEEPEVVEESSSEEVEEDAVSMSSGGSGGSGGDDEVEDYRPPARRARRGSGTPSASKAATPSSTERQTQPIAAPTTSQQVPSASTGPRRPASFGTATGAAARRAGASTQRTAASWGRPR